MSDGKHSRTLCIFCGADALKVNLLKCADCGEQPNTAEELAYAMAYSDFFYSDETLDRIAADLRRGGPRPGLPAKEFSEILEFAGSIDLEILFAGREVKH